MLPTNSWLNKLSFYHRRLFNFRLVKKGFEKRQGGEKPIYFSCCSPVVRECVLGTKMAEMWPFYAEQEPLATSWLADWQIPKESDRKKKNPRLTKNKHNS